MSSKPPVKRKGPDKSRTAAGKRVRQLTETSAGGFVYKRTPNGVRFVLIRDPYGKWTFPKGHQEPGEDLKATALRETREELGLGRLRLVRPLGRIEIWFRDRYRPDSKGALVHKYIHYFLFEAPGRAKGQPQKKEKISHLTWATPAQARKLNGYPDVRPLLEKAISATCPKRRWAKRSGQPAGSANRPRRPQQSGRTAPSRVNHPRSSNSN